MIHPARIRQLNTLKPQSGKVIYWMSRDQRAEDNWALLHAAELAAKSEAPVAVVFCLLPHFGHAIARQYHFMLKGLKETEAQLKKNNIPFILLEGAPDDVLPEFVKKHQVAQVVCDFTPLRQGRKWRSLLAKKVEVPVWEVDAHNIVPCWHVSQKQEVGARTLRPKIHKLLPEFLERIPPVKKSRHDWPGGVPKIEWLKLLAKYASDDQIEFGYQPQPGSTAAEKTLHDFIDQRLDKYEAHRNDPNQAVQSGLSPYLHFGHISAQKVALAVNAARAHQASKAAFLEELIVRRELSDNFCFYNPQYDQVTGFPAWAQKSLDLHRDDHREFLYTLAELTSAKTHDDLWNAAQMEMVKTGKMHGYLRMYWAKKILEWSPSPEIALEHILKLNDTYFLDGRDPNGYTGAAWSVGGVHDRPWFDRPIYGVVRYMNYNGSSKKFSIPKYVARIAAL